MRSCPHPPFTTLAQHNIYLWYEHIHVGLSSAFQYASPSLLLITFFSGVVKGPENQNLYVRYSHPINIKRQNVGKLWVNMDNGHVKSGESI